MEKLQVNKSDVLACYNHSSQEAKEALKALFGAKTFEFDYTTIKSFEDACKHLNISQEVPNMNYADYDMEALEMCQAMYKLRVICKAINNGKATDEDGDVWYPVYVLYSKSELEYMGEEERKRKGIQLLSAAYAVDAENSGVRCAHAADRGAYTNADYGFPLCANSEEKAMYLRKQFHSLILQCYGLKLKEGE